MPTPRVAGIADDMLAYLKKAKLSDAQRRYNPTTEASELSTRRITVVPGAWRHERGERRGDHRIDELKIYVEQHVDPADSLTIDNLVYAVQLIWALYDAGGDLRTATLNSCKWNGEIEFDMDELFDAEMLRDTGIFRSVTIVRYRTD